MSNPHYDLVDLLADLLADHSDETGVSMPGRVVSYDRATQRANVQPCVNRRLRDADDEDVDLFERFPEIPSVPVLWPAGGSSFVHPYLAPGDSVLLVVADSDYAAWARTGDAGDPSDARTHHYAHTFAVPSPRPRSAPLPSGRTVFAAEGEAVSLAVAEELDKVLHVWMSAVQAGAAAATTGTQAAQLVVSSFLAARYAVPPAMPPPTPVGAASWASSRFKQDAEPVLP